MEQFENRLNTTKVEIEQKFRVQNPNPVRKRLEALQAIPGTRGWEHNELYDQERALRGKKQILRLRYHGTKDAWLTFKGPREKNGRAKKRLEVESPVHFEDMKRILKLLGYKVISTYRKYREEYDLLDAKVCLDHLPSHGWFVEIEGTTRAIQKTARKLKLDPKHTEERSYRRLLKEPMALA